MLRSRNFVREDFQLLRGANNTQDNTASSQQLSQSDVDKFVEDGGKITKCEFGESGLPDKPVRAKLRGAAKRSHQGQNRLRIDTRRRIQAQFDDELTETETVSLTRELAQRYSVSYQTIRNIRFEKIQD